VLSSTRSSLTGIAAYLFLEEDFRLRLSGIEHWQGDGIIADFDDPAVAAALAAATGAGGGVGGSYERRGRLSGRRALCGDRQLSN
jgi:LacI family transcriptional regulator